MDHQTIELLRHYAEKYNAGDSTPNCRVEVYRMDGKKDYEVAPFIIPDVIEVSLDRRYNLATGDLKVMISNKNGELSPNYSPGIRYDNVKGLKPNGFSNVLIPFNKIVLYLGYGDEMRMMFTGQIVSVNITERPPTIVLNCKDMYRMLLKPIDPEKEKVLKYENKSAGIIITDLLTRSGVPNTFDYKILNGKEYIIEKKVFPLGTQYNDALKEIVQMLAHRTYCNRKGFVVVEPIKRYTQEESAKLELNDYVNLTSGEYTLDAAILRNRVIVQANDGWKAYEDLGLIKDCNGEKISCALESPWATDEEDGTPKRKQAVADRFFMDQRKRYRKLTIGAKGHPALDVGDLVRVRELISTANSNYMITGIKTSYSSMGYVDTIDLEYVSKDVHIATLAEGQYQGVDDVIGGGKVVPMVLTNRNQIGDEARKHRNLSYEHNGDVLHEPDKFYGIDNEHFLWCVYEQFGLLTEYHTIKEIYGLCQPIEESALREGDLVFYTSDGSVDKISQAAIYLGNGTIIAVRGGAENTTTEEFAKGTQARVKITSIKDIPKQRLCGTLIK